MVESVENGESVESVQAELDAANSATTGAMKSGDAAEVNKQFTLAQKLSVKLAALSLESTREARDKATQAVRDYLKRDAVTKLLNESFELGAISFTILPVETDDGLGDPLVNASEPTTKRARNGGNGGGRSNVFVVNGETYTGRRELLTSLASEYEVELPDDMTNNSQIWSRSQTLIQSIAKSGVSITQDSKEVLVKNGNS